MESLGQGGGKQHLQVQDGLQHGMGYNGSQQEVEETPLLIQAMELLGHQAQMEMPYLDHLQ